MKYKVMYTAGAKRDLRNIFIYISEELLAPENAAGQTERIMTAIRKLDTVRIMYRGRDVRKQLSRTEDISEN